MGAISQFWNMLDVNINQLFSYSMCKHGLLILSRLDDFVTCSSCFNIQSERSISQLLNIIGR